MSSQAVRSALAELPHFREAGEAVLDRMEAISRELELQPGDEVFREGARCDAFFVVIEGLVKIYRLQPDGREQIVHHVAAGRSFAEAALFHYGRYPAWAAAAGPARLVRIDGEAFLALLAEEKALAASMVGSLCVWLHTLLDRIDVLTHVSAGARLALHLLRLPARQGPGGLVVHLDVPKKALAGQLSITPETLSRILARWRERGIVAVDGPDLTLRDTDALELLADSEEG